MTDGGQHIVVVPEQVREVGKYVYELADALRAALDAAAKDVGALTGGGWTGDSATEFANGWTDVRDGGARIMSALTGMAEKLGVTAATYETRDATNAIDTSSLDLP
ncbi:WXG100 family type VII secretion target [Nocardia altamirensis]|uniref:WXG100 family type VII secretion target n=1 Tax=Nocardia altamirensis TaxID=472158 RepID=UPI000840032D|nr:WXG100 family type VII secretion target [Nocardia altamirensis]